MKSELDQKNEIERIFKFMKNKERTIRIYRKVDVNETMEERHKKVMKGLSELEAPLGLKDSEIPEVPDFGVEIRAHYRTKNYKTKGVSISGDYIWRDESSEKGRWDSLEYDFKITYELINYKKIIYEDLPKVKSCKIKCHYMGKNKNHKSFLWYD